ncbi:MAG: dethiobiotin synthase [Mariprofundales bacterium]
MVSKTNIFITATDTDAGKTFVTTALLRLLRKHTDSVLACKPIAAGCNHSGVNDDVQKLLQVQEHMTATDINCWTFSKPSAPLFADTKQIINATTLRQWCKQREDVAELVLFEAIGGLLVPLTSSYSVADWLQDLPLAHVLLVVRAHLGGLNHTLLTLEKLQLMQRFPAWVIINDADNCGADMLQQHVYCVRQTYPDCRITLLPYDTLAKTLTRLQALADSIFYCATKRKIS